MKLYFEGGHITIDDDDPRAIKIRQGYKYTIDVNGKLKIGTKKVNFNLDAFVKKLETKTATLDDIQEYILALLTNKIIK